MKTINIGLFAFFCLGWLLSCQSDNTDWKKTYKGKFSYKIIPGNETSAKGDTIGYGDIITFHYILKNGNKVIESTYLNGVGATELELPPKPERNQFMEALTLARQGDSLLVRIKYKDASDELSSYTEHFKSGDEATFSYKIINVESRASLLQAKKLKLSKDKGYNGIEEMDTERNYYIKAADSLYQMVKTQIEAKKSGKLALEKSKEGIQIHYLEKPQDGKKIEAGDTVYVIYMGLVEKDAVIFDNIFFKKGERLVFTVADSNFQAPMLHKSVQLLQKGCKATIFVPSALGYGKKGSGKTVPPNADLVLYLDVAAVHPKQ